MSDKLPKTSDVEQLLKFIKQSGDSHSPLDLTEEQMVKWARISFCHNKRKIGYGRKQVVDMLMAEHGPMSLHTAYRIVAETEQVIGPTSVSTKDYAKVLAEEWILQGIRLSIASKDLRHMHQFVSKYMDLHGLKDGEALTIPPDALERHVTRLSMNPEDVGMKRMSIEEIRTFVESMTRTPAPKVLDITPKDDGGEE